MGAELGVEEEGALACWRRVAAEDYEGHMAHPRVAQSRALGDCFARALAELSPRRILLPGCATGNGLERLRGLPLERVTAVDGQADYLELARRRHAAPLPSLELVLADLESWEPPTAAYQLVYCALVLEYVEPFPLLRRLARALEPGGELWILLQLPAEGQGRVSETPFVGVRQLEPVIRLCDPASLREPAHACGLRPVEESRLELPTGKSFQLLRWRAAD